VRFWSRARRFFAVQSTVVPSIFEPTLLLSGATLAAASAAATIVSQIVNEFVLGSGQPQLDVDREWNIWAWVGSASILAAASVAFLSAVAIRAWAVRLGMLAAWFAFLSLDDIVEVHERIGIRLGTATGLIEGDESARLWVVVYLPAMAVSLVVLLKIRRELCSAPAQRVMHWGLLLIGLAVAAEVLGSVTRRIGGSGAWPYDLTVAVEEAAETAGWILLATGVAAVLFAAVAAAEERP